MREFERFVFFWECGGLPAEGELDAALPLLLLLLSPLLSVFARRGTACRARRFPERCALPAAGWITQRRNLTSRLRAAEKSIPQNCCD
jgi:hypothetical protein